MSRIEPLVGEILRELGEDPSREGLVRTPGRVARSFRFLTQGYEANPHEILNEAVFEESYDEMLVVKDIDFYSLCEHHLLPFHGRAHVAYLPNGRVVGLSKLARTVEAFARRPQVQERMTCQIADALMEHLEPKGAAVVIEAAHLCMKMRGIQKPNGVMVTSALRGVFKESPSARAEVLALINDARRNCG